MSVEVSLSRRSAGVRAAAALFTSSCLADQARGDTPDVNVAIAWLGDDDAATAPGRTARLIDDIATLGPRPAMIVLLARDWAFATVHAAANVLSAQAEGWGMALRILKTPGHSESQAHDLVTTQSIPKSAL